MSAHKGHTVDKTVVVVEDNPTNLKLTRDLLQLLECRVVEVSRAEDAIRIIEEQDVDLVLMDIQLPGMDGLTATRVIREEMGIKDLPIIGVSALAMDGDREKAMQAGCIEYITKPMDTRMFMGMVTRCLATVKCGLAVDRRETGSKVERRRILVVDDNPTNIKLFKAMLPEDKYEVHEALNGAAALKLTASVLPDVIFLDIMMPDMDGYEVTKRLKINNDTTHIPVVLVTALEESKHRIRGLEAGAEDVLVKPVNRVEVLARTRSMVRLGDYRNQVALRMQASGLPSPDTEDTDVSEKGGTARILIVEDNARELELLKASLANEPYEVLSAGTGQEALTILRKNDVDLIILDILLPDLNGFDVLESAKKIAGRNTVQTVVTTCLADLESKVRGVELGVDDYLVKPINSRELKVRLTALLKKKAYMDQLKHGCLGDMNAAIRDSLTGAYNREFFMRFVDLELKRSIRHNYSTSLVKVVVDEIEQFDGSGKSVTEDSLLREIFSVLKDALREVDLVARCDDAGFVVLLPNCNEAGGLNVINRAREALAYKESPFSAGLLGKKVSVNFGSVTCPGEAQTTDQMIALLQDRIERDRIMGEARINKADEAGLILTDKV